MIMEGKGRSLLETVEALPPWVGQVGRDFTSTVKVGRLKFSSYASIKYMVLLYIGEQSVS